MIYGFDQSTRIQISQYRSNRDNQHLYNGLLFREIILLYWFFSRKVDKVDYQGNPIITRPVGRGAVPSENTQTTFTVTLLISIVIMKNGRNYLIVHLHRPSISSDRRIVSWQNVSSILRTCWFVICTRIIGCNTISKLATVLKLANWY